MIRFSYAEATVVVMDENREFTASVTVDGDQMAVRQGVALEVWTIAGIVAEGSKRWSITTVEHGVVTVRRLGGCGCR